MRMMEKDQALRNWLRGMSCKHQTHMDCVWESDCGRFVVFRHFSHTTYVDRMTGSANCEAHQDLIDLENLGVDCYGRYDHLKTWGGRWNKAKAGQAEKLITRLNDYNFEKDSDPKGVTLCGKLGRKHRMRRVNSMRTVCVFPGCNGLC